MPGVRARRLALAAAVLVAVALRAARLAGGPFIHPDGPAYLDLARRLAPDARAFVGYFPPGYPLAIRLMHGLGLAWEPAARAVSCVAGVLLVPLVAALATLVLDPAAGVVAAALAAVHPHLVRASTEVLPEALQAAVVAVWALLLLGPAAAGRARLAAAGVVAALAALVRPEGVVLVPLTAIAATLEPGPRRLARAALALAAAAIVLVPLVAVVHARTGIWAIGGKEAVLVARRYRVGATGVAGLVLGHPRAFFATWARFLRAQLEYTLTGIHVLLVVPLGVGLAASVRGAGERRARAVVLAAVGLLTLAIAVNPGRRYVVPLLPLVLPWAARGVERLGAAAAGRRLLRPAAVAAAGALIALAVEGLHRHEVDTAACYRVTCAWLVARYGAPLPPLVAGDVRLAYVCGAPFVLEPGGDARAALALARARGARLWVTTHRPSPAIDALVPVAERCEGKHHLTILEVRPAG
ncbi:MAG TPA: glycosyltransferase family 39 protein [Candidatus Binatia bacterium]|nr:glycosyltransferase family 39 protein [Candidatus Binatia bacterium]